MTEGDIRAALTRYRVQKHYRASRAAGSSRYAIFTGKAEQISEPKTFREASDEVLELIVADIMRAAK